MRILKEHFNSIHQMLEIVNKRSNNEVMKNQNSSQTDDEEFTLTESWEQAIDLFQYGYKDIMDEIKIGMKKETKFQAATHNRKIKTGVQGYAPHVPNAILGLPNSMIDMKSEVRKVKAISIVYSITESAGVEAEEFVKSGIAVLSTIYALELRGVRVNLKIMFYDGKSEDERAFASVNLKDYREHLDLQKLCFPVAHPSMSRRLGFKWLETVPELECNGWSYGYGSQMKTEEFFEIEGLFKQNEHFLNLDITKECDYNTDRIIEKLDLK